MKIKDMKPGMKALILVAILVPTTILGFVIYDRTTKNFAIDFSGGIGFAKIEQQTPSSSGHPMSASADLTSSVVKVLENGTFGNLITSGEAKISHLFASPNEKVYIIFEPAHRAIINGTHFILVEADPKTNEIKGINSDLLAITFASSSNYFMNPSVQSDSSGALYYRGESMNQNWVLQRHHEGQITDLINENIEIYDFLVLPDDSVLIHGVTLSNHQNWLRRISPSGGISNIVAQEYLYFMKLLPDGNVCFGFWGDTLKGIYIYNTTTNQLGSEPYLSSMPELTPQYLMSDIFGEEFIGISASINEIYEMDDGRVFGLSIDNKIVFQLYPTVMKLNSSIPKPYAFNCIGSKLVIAGTDATGNNQLTLYDPETDSEEDLLPDHEFEVYHLVDGGSGTLYFDGLNFGNNKYAVCNVNLQTKALSISETQNNVKISDFQKY